MHTDRYPNEISFIERLLTTFYYALIEVSDQKLTS